MRILILSRKRSLYSTRRLKEEGERRGCGIDVVDPLKCVLLIHGRRPELMACGRTVPRPDVVLPRLGTAGTIHSLAVIRQLELMGVPSVNRSAAIARAKDKLGCLQLLASKRVPVPETLIARYPRDLTWLVRKIGGAPLVIKMLRGTQGTGVMLAESYSAAESVLEAVWSLGEDVMLQRFVAESRGRDVRVLVVDGKVRASMRRVGKEGEFRSNIHRGGRGEKVELPSSYCKAAVAAARAVGLRLAGVDLLESKEGPLVVEVNASPGFQGLEVATGENVARLFIDAARRVAREGR